MRFEYSFVRFRFRGEEDVRKKMQILQRRRETTKLSATTVATTGILHDPETSLRDCDVVDMSYEVIVTLTSVSQISAIQ